MTRRMLGRDLVVTVVVVAVTLVFVGLRAARIRSYEAACQSNQRQLTYACFGYACDWRCKLPPRTARPGGVLNGVYRLPVIGFDSATAWTWGSYAPGGDGVSYLGGWGFLMRDYLKNDFDVAACPDGWYTKDDLLQPWDGKGIGTLYSEKMGYLWLPHRDVPTAAANGRRSVDTEADLLRTSSDKPEMFVMADYVMWVGDRNTFRISGNHQRTKAGNAAPARWPEFNPDEPGSGPGRDRPTYSNAVRLDVKLARREFLDLSMYRYIVDVTPRVHVW